MVCAHPNWAVTGLGLRSTAIREETAQQSPPALDLLPQLRAELPSSVLLICEGGIASPADARLALQAGADTVVVGTAITGVDLQVIAYRQGMIS